MQITCKIIISNLLLKWKQVELCSSECNLNKTYQCMIQIICKSKFVVKLSESIIGDILGKITSALVFSFVYYH